MKTILPLILTLLIVYSGRSQSTDLSFNLIKNKEYKQVSTSKVSVEQEINGQKINMIMTIGGTLTFLVKDKDKNGYDMDAQFEYLSMSMQMPQGTSEFNSDKNDENDFFSSLLGAMKNKTFGITMSKTGKITEVKNAEALWETLINQLEVPEMAKEQVKAQISKAYGADALKGNIEMATAIYPDRPVNKGDKWKIDTKLESGMSALMTTEYEFVDVTSEYALIKGNSEIKTDDKEAYIQTNGMPLKYDLAGTMLSEIKVDKKTGWIIEAKIKQEIKGDAYIKENPQFPEGLKIPMIMQNEMTITDN